MHVHEPVLSAVVFAYRNEGTILRVVASLMEQDFDEPFEVIVATSGGDRTATIVRAAYPEVHVVESPVRMMPGGARNLGMQLARGEIVAFLEGDCIARPGWMRHRVAAHRAGHEAVASAVAVANPETSAARATAFLCYDNRLEGARGGAAGLPRSFGLSFTRELLNRTGPFDEDLRTEEDTQMAERLNALGVHAWFEPAVCIEHVGPTSLGELMTEQAARGRRQARSDILTRPAGSFRVGIESKAGVLPLALALRTLHHGLVRCRFLLRNLQHCARNRPELARTSPWIVLGLLAHTWGWAREQYAYAFRGSFTESDCTGPSRAPLRRRLTTTGDKVLALTFDDGPSEFTSAVLDVTARYAVPATFFVLGERAESMPDAIRAIAGAGHGLGIHGWDHTAFTEFDQGVLVKELCRTECLLRDLSGVECRDIRPPYGFYDGQLISLLASRGNVTWLWTADARDFEPDATVDGIATRALISLTPGGIILLHDGGGDRSRTVQALPRIIEGALARGYRFVTLPEVHGEPSLLPFDAAQSNDCRATVGGRDQGRLGHPTPAS